LKKIGPVDVRLIAITDRRIASVNDRARALIEGGITALMLREKDLAPAQLQALAEPLARMCRDAGVVFLINGSIEVALACGADGVHLGGDGKPPAVVRSMIGSRLALGVSIHNDQELADAMEGNPDYVLASPVFPPSSKPCHGPCLGLEGLGRLASRSSVPVVALGGMRAGCIKACLEAGAVGVAAIGALFGAHEPRQAARSLRAEVTANL